MPKLAVVRAQYVVSRRRDRRRLRVQIFRQIRRKRRRCNVSERSLRPQTDVSAVLGDNVPNGRRSQIVRRVEVANGALKLSVNALELRAISGNVNVHYPIRGGGKKQSEHALCD